jgi:hypothetical protein
VIVLKFQCKFGPIFAIGVKIFTQTDVSIHPKYLIVPLGRKDYSDT